MSDANRSALITIVIGLGQSTTLVASDRTSRTAGCREHLERELGAVDGCQRRAGGQLDRFGPQRIVGRCRHLPLADGDARAAEVRRCHEGSRDTDLPTKLAGQDRQADEPERGVPASVWCASRLLRTWLMSAELSIRNGATSGWKLVTPTVS